MLVVDEYAEAMKAVMLMAAAGAVVSSALLCATVPNTLENGCKLMYDGIG